MFGGAVDIAGRVVAPRPTGLADLRVGEGDTLGHVGRRLAPFDAGRQFACRDTAVIFLGQRTDLIHRHVADDDKDRIVGRIPGMVEIHHVIAGQRLDLVVPANHRVAIGVVHEEGGGGLFVQAAPGFILDP